LSVNTENYNSITPAMKSRIADDLRYAGPIRSITLISRKEIGEKQQYRYRLAYRNYAYVVQCTFDRNGKIVDVGSPRE
jgi:hypothetical protein